MSTYNPALLSSTRYARVNFAHGMAPMIAVKLELQDVGTPFGGAGPGMTQDEAVQVVADLALARDVVVNAGRPLRYAAFADGKWLGNLLAEDTPDAAGAELVPIVGDGPRRIVSPPSDGLPDNWPIILSDACDAVIRRVAKADRTSQIPIGYSMAIPVIAPVIAAIIVGGAAVAVIGTVAAWRYLDPQARTAVKLLEASSQAYRSRLETFRETGKMPPASDLETNTASEVLKLAGEGKSGSYLVGGLVGAGVMGAVGGGLLIGKALEK